MGQLEKVPGVLHIVPCVDLVAHETARDTECVCGPDTVYVEHGHIVTHHSLDGREIRELPDVEREDRAA